MLSFSGFYFCLFLSRFFYLSQNNLKNLSHAAFFVCMCGCIGASICASHTENCLTEPTVSTAQTCKHFLLAVGKVQQENNEKMYILIGSISSGFQVPSVRKLLSRQWTRNKWCYSYLYKEGINFFHSSYYNYCSYLSIKCPHSNSLSLSQRWPDSEADPPGNCSLIETLVTQPHWTLCCEHCHCQLKWLLGLLFSLFVWGTDSAFLYILFSLQYTLCNCMSRTFSLKITDIE